MAGGFSFFSEVDIRAAEIFEPPISEVGFIGTVPQADKLGLLVSVAALLGVVFPLKWRRQANGTKG